MGARLGSVVLVAVGGAAGTGAREALTLVLPAIGRFPLAVLLVNLAGAFLLGALLESLPATGPRAIGARRARLLAGTGFCGGFTTYSALATATAALLTTGAALIGIAYALGTVVLGAGATWAGVALAARAAPR